MSSQIINNAATNKSKTTKRTEHKDMVLSNIGNLVQIILLLFLLSIFTHVVYDMNQMHNQVCQKQDIERFMHELKELNPDIKIPRMSYVCDTPSDNTEFPFTASIISVLQDPTK